MIWRTGRKVGRTIYLQKRWEPSDGDQLIGVMDTVELAARVVAAVNGSGYVDDVRREMVVSLDEALHGTSVARAASPLVVWGNLLAEVRSLVEHRQGWKIP